MTRHDQIQKSRLGRILVNRGYISEQQLDAALIAQAERGMMLGEVLVADGLITEKDLGRVLRHQKNYRFRYCSRDDDCCAAPAYDFHGRFSRCFTP